MKEKIHHSLLGCGLAALTAAAGLVTAHAGPGPKDYDAALGEVNGSGVTGSIFLSDWDTSRICVYARGLEPGREYTVGIVASNKATCPPPEADVNGDGVIDGGEGAAWYGDFIVTTGAVLTANAEGVIENQCVYFTVPNLKGSLDDRVVVLTGFRIGGVFDDDAPAACGELNIRPKPRRCNPRRQRC